MDKLRILFGPLQRFLFLYCVASIWASISSFAFVLLPPIWPSPAFSEGFFSTASFVQCILSVCFNASFVVILLHPLLVILRLSLFVIFKCAFWLFSIVSSVYLFSASIVYSSSVSSVLICFFLLRPLIVLLLRIMSSICCALCWLLSCVFCLSIH